MENTPIKISTLQVILLIIICRIFTAYAYLPILNTPPQNQDVWILIPISIIYAIFFSIPLLYLGSRFANLSLLEYIDLIFGKVFGKIICAMYALFFFFICFIQMGVIQDFIHTSILHRTPVYAMLLFMGAVCIYLVFQGLEPIVRIVEVFAPLVILTVIIFSLLAIPQMNFKAFLPVLKESRFIDLNFGGLLTAARFYDVVMLSMLASHLKQGTNLTKIVAVTVSIFSVIFLLMVISVQATLGVDQSQHVSYPYYTFTQQIQISDLIQHIESINITALFFAIFIKFSIYLYLTSISLRKVLNFKNSKSSLIPVTLIIVGVLSFSDIGKDVILDNIISSKISPYIFIVFIFILPLIILSAYIFRRKKITSKYNKIVNQNLPSE